MGLASAGDIVAALKDYGLKVVEDGGWRSRGTGYRFDPYGQAWHHDALTEAVSDARALEIMRTGRPDLTGPLCNGWIDSSSVVYLVAYGNANHAGRNESDVHARLKAGKAPLGDARLDPDGDDMVGNPFLWGWECRNAGDGTDVWDQLDAMERAGAALCDACGWSPNAQAAHRELTKRKPDPVGFSMPTFRADVAHIQAAHNAPPGEEDDVPYIIKGSGYATRFVDFPAVFTISATAEKALVADGVKVLHMPQPEAAKLVEQSGQALD